MQSAKAFAKAICDGYMTLEELQPYLPPPTSSNQPPKDTNLLQPKSKSTAKKKSRKTRRPNPQSVKSSLDISAVFGQDYSDGANDTRVVASASSKEQTTRALRTVSTLNTTEDTLDISNEPSKRSSKAPLENSFKTRCKDTHSTKTACLTENTSPVKTEVRGRLRSASKSMSHMELTKLKVPVDNLATAIEQLNNETSPLSLIESRRAAHDRRKGARKERSESIKFLRQRIASRESSASPKSKYEEKGKSPVSLLPFVTASTAKTGSSPSKATPDILEPSTKVTSSVFDSWHSETTLENTLESKGLSPSHRKPTITTPSHHFGPKPRRPREEFARNVAIPYKLSDRQMGSPTPIIKAKLPVSIKDPDMPKFYPSRDVYKKHGYKDEQRVTVPTIGRKDTAGDSIGPATNTQTYLTTKKANLARSSSCPHLSGFCMFSNSRELSRTRAVIPNSDEDQSEDETEVSEMLIRKSRCRLLNLSKEPYAYTPWAARFAWFYLSVDHQHNQECVEAGLSPYPSAKIYLPPPEENPRYEQDQGDAPALLHRTKIEHIFPVIVFDEENFRFIISPHSQPFEDIRNDPNHPDHLPPEMLCEYQAFEVAGFEVWRHDRNTLTCILPSCSNVTEDHDVLTYICHGCGPKTWVRYCCKQHLFDDMVEHWKECGDISTVLPHVVDETTQPDRFSRRYPAIKDITGARSFYKHRQRTHAIYNKGQYTLFSASGLPFVIDWPQDLVHMYKGRVERLLNIAFFDQNQTICLEYLYRLLRLCIRTSKSVDRIKYDHTSVLSRQFFEEFDWDAAIASDEDPCECYWLGDSAAFSDCRGQYCPCQKLFRSVGVISRAKGLRAYVENLEAKHWQLRVWRRQHPTVKGWRRKLVGEGFPGVDKQQVEELTERHLWISWTDA